MTKYIHKNPNDAAPYLHGKPGDFDFAPYLHGKPGDRYDSAILYDGISGKYGSWTSAEEGSQMIGSHPTLDDALAALLAWGYVVFEEAAPPVETPIDPLATLRERARAASEMFGLPPIGGHAEDVFRRAADLTAQGVSPAWLLGESK